MSDEILARLRAVGGYFDEAALRVVSLSECADEITRLRAELAAERETYTDPDGRTWYRPSARGYSQVMKVLDERDEEIEQLNAELAAEREARMNATLSAVSEKKLHGLCRHNLKNAEAERDAMRAELAASKVNEGYCTELCCTAQTCFDAVVKQRDALRALLREASEYVLRCRTGRWSYPTQADEGSLELLDRIDRALKGDGDE